MVSPIRQSSRHESASVTDLYQSVRARTLEIVAPLEIEDYVIQTAEFMSPPRWHIGHTSWFFETVLQKYQTAYHTYSEDFLFFFNSYYEGFGARIERPKRGTRSRPTVAETRKYRAHVDDLMLQFIDTISGRDDAQPILSIIRLGLEHEMQHQELLVYDIKHLLCDQFDAPMKAAPRSVENVSGMVEIEGGLFELGYAERYGTARDSERVSTGKDAGEPPAEMRALHGMPALQFAWDNEKPAHRVWLEDFSIDRAPVSNGDYLEFINDGGYQNFRWWYSAGWEKVNTEHWQAP